MEEKKKDEPLCIMITLSTDDIYKLATGGRTMKNGKINFLFGFLFVTLQVVNSLFILLLAYFRPALITSTYSCYNMDTHLYNKCFVKSLCACYSSPCVKFCYEPSYEKCEETFLSTLNNDLNWYYLREQGKTYIKYDIEGKENLSIFQGIGDNFCHTHNLILLCIGCFAIGGIIGYYIFGLLSDIQGKYFVIKIMSIGIIVSMIPICVIANFSLEKNHTLFIALWSVFLVFVGFFLCPLESLLHVYYLELSPTIDFLLPLNGLLYERYFISILVFYIFNQYIKNFVYYFYFFEVYMVGFVVLFFIMYMETPRYYHEREDYLNKKLIIKEFVEDRVVFTFGKGSSSQLQNQKKLITLEMISKEIKQSQFLSDKNILFSLFFFSLSICFYMNIISIIFDFLNPNTPMKESTRRGVLCYIIILFPLLQLPSYFCYKLIDLDKFIMFLLFVLSFIPFNYDLGSITLNSDGIEYFGTYAMKKIKNIHPYILASSLWLITFIMSLFEILVMMQPPTLYRTSYYFTFKSFSHITILLAYLSNYFLEGKFICVSLICLGLACVFSVNEMKLKSGSFDENKN